MGYYSRFDVKTSSPVDTSRLLDELKLFTDYTFYNYGQAIYLDEAKWYDYVENMVLISTMKHYKDILFTITIQGESIDGYFKAYFKNGKYVVNKGEMIFPEFNEDQLE